MPRYYVTGTVTVPFSVHVDADGEYHAAGLVAANITTELIEGAIVDEDCDWSRAEYDISGAEMAVEKEEASNHD